jgi:hypothetical protein
LVWFVSVLVWPSAAGCVCEWRAQPGGSTATTN